MVAKLPCKFADLETLSLLGVMFDWILMSLIVDHKHLGATQNFSIFKISYVVLFITCHSDSTFSIVYDVHLQLHTPTLRFPSNFQ